MKLLNYQQIGQGSNLVLIHGLFGSLENLNSVAKALASDYCVTSIDVRNHGNSFHENNMSYQVLAQDIAYLLDHLAIKQAHILGHSMGGKIAMKLALTQPSLIDKLIIADIAPVTYPAHHTNIIKGLLAIDLTQIKNRHDADKQLAKYVDNQGVRQFLLRNLSKDPQGNFYFKCNIDYINQCYEQIMQGFENDNNSYQGDTLFIKGGNSDYIRSEHRNIIIKLFPQSKAKILNGAGHWLHAEKTTVFNKIVKDFLVNKC